MKLKNFLALVLLVAAGSVLYSFVSPMGGEGFEIYIDNKLVLQQFNRDMKQVKNIELNATHSKSELKVKYYHCGMAGKSRTLELKNADQKTVKHWQFANAEGKNFAIAVPVKEIVSSNDKKSTTLYLYYASKETPQGRMLAGITVANKNTVTGK
ncbi:MAG TPA: hypothetical protein VFV46_02695 [Lacibacter sp.]|nr:hypothetical protein [Lacibacter sp.]